MERTPIATALLPAALRCVAAGRSKLPDGTRSSREEIAWLVARGMGPLLHRLMPAGGYAGIGDAGRTLHAAAFTSVAITCGARAAAEEIVLALRADGIEPVLLKGIAWAFRYYPQPHLRVMGDLDVLVPPGDIERATRCLRSLGYEDKPNAGRSLHHAPPLRHPDRGVEVELHHALLPATAAAASTAPLDLADYGAETVAGPFGSTTARFLTPECDAMLIAAGWCRDLTGHLGLRGTPRPLLDTVVLVGRNPDLDWDRILRWSRATFAGACLALLLGYLERLEAWGGPAGMPQRLLAAQPHVRAASAGVAYAILDRHLVRLSEPGRVLSPHVLESVLDALIAPRPAWRNLLHVPWNVAFPRRESRRFQPRYLLRRLVSALGR